MTNMLKVAREAEKAAEAAAAKGLK